MDGQDGVAGIVLLVKEGPELALLQAPLELLDGRFDVGVDALSLFRELSENVELVLRFLEPLEELKVLLQPLLLLLDRLGGLLVLPGLRGGQPSVEGVPFGFLAI
jgi:hypothetical protein